MQSRTQEVGTFVMQMRQKLARAETTSTSDICTGLEEGEDITSDAPRDGRLTQWRLQNLSSIERSESHAPITKGRGVWFNPKIIICSLYLKIILYRRVNFVKTYIDSFVC